MNKLQKRLSVAAAAAAAPFISAAPVLAQLGDPEPPQGFVTNMGQMISGLLNFVMIVAAILVFVYLIMGGIEWITSGGDKSKTEGARNKITAAIIGLIILAASWALLQLALQLLGFPGGLSEVFERGVIPITGE